MAYIQSNILCHHVGCFYCLIASLPSQVASAEERMKEEEKMPKGPAVLPQYDAVCKHHQ